jgi:hypothetical protein
MMQPNVTSGACISFLTETEESSHAGKDSLLAFWENFVMVLAIAHCQKYICSRG